jgi:hypothetical protein
MQTTPWVVRYLKKTILCFRPLLCPIVINALDITTGRPY